MIATFAGDIGIKAMNVQRPQLFTPPRPPPPAKPLGWLQFFSAIRTNALAIWPQEAYERDVVSGSTFGRRRFLFNAPKAIHRVLVENVSNYVRTPATIRILRPIVGAGLFLSEGDDWHHQRRTIAPALAPRVIPMLATHIAAAAQESVTRLAAAAVAPTAPVDMLAAMQFLALEIAARSMISLEMRSHGPALRALITQFAVRLGRPYFFDLMLPVGILTPRDLARRRFRSRWIALMDAIIDFATRPAGRRPASRSVRHAARGARSGNRSCVFTRSVARSGRHDDRCRP